MMVFMPLVLVWIGHLQHNLLTTQVVETSVTNNSLSEDYSHPELDSEDDYNSGSRNVSHQQQSF